MPQRTLSQRSTKIKRIWRNLIPPNHRAYFASHPLGFCVALGLAIGGFINLLFPDAIRETSASLALPPALFYAFSVSWALGGTCASWGLLRGVRGLEAGGDVLLSSAIIVDYITVVAVRSTAALSSVFLVFLALGFALRARHLTKTGYAIVAIPLKAEHDVPPG